MNQLIAKALGVATGTVDWKATFILAAMRSASAGVTWAFIMLLSGNPDSFFPFLLLGAPIGVLFMVPLALVALVGAKIFPPIGLLGLIPLVFIVSGDPLLWLVERFRPETVPMDDFKPINGKTILVVFNPEMIEMVENVKANVKAEAASVAKAAGASAMNKLRGLGANDRSQLYDNDTEQSNSPGELSQRAAHKRHDESSMEGTRHEQRYEDALKLFESGDGKLRVEGVREFSALAEEGAKIPELYFRLAMINKTMDPVDNWASILRSLEEFCKTAAIANDDLHTHPVALGIASDMAGEVADALWEGGHKEASITYLHSLRYWLQLGNTLTAQSDVKPRLAFERARIIADLDAKDGNEDRRDDLLEFCSEFKIDPEIVIEG